MARSGIVFGLLLCSVSLVGMILAPAKTPTQFTPMMAGIPLLFFGIVGLNPHRRRVATYLSMLALVPAIAYGTLRCLQLLGNDQPIAEFNEKVAFLMTLLAMIFLIWAAWAVHRDTLNRRPNAHSAAASKPSPGLVEEGKRDAADDQGDQGKPDDLSSKRVG
ncbi:MAG: hypothetical protein AAF958_05405 [Planctomycetota bacterium]